jgi:catechol 2,3-dioxygenase-like lactoylglutathione lyase family enzyme
MAGELTYPILPCRDLDDAIGFYEALGFTKTYRQIRPNPYAVVARDDLQFHLFGMPEFDPEQSYGSVSVVVPDPDALYQSFATGLRAVYGKLPIRGIPRVTRPRKRFGTVYGFSVVDVGGNWLRVSKLGAKEDAADTGEAGLPKVVDVAARLADAHGEDETALKTLTTALSRYADAPPLDRLRALLLQAELAVRVGEVPLASSSLREAETLALVADLSEEIGNEYAYAAELVGAALE